MSNSICPVCNLPLEISEYYPQGYCSDFCERFDDDVKAKFKALKKGDFGIYPCSKCGLPIDDEYDPESCLCSTCWPRVKVNVLLARIVELETALTALNHSHCANGCSHEGCAHRSQEYDQAVSLTEEALTHKGASCEDLYKRFQKMKVDSTRP